MKKWLRARQGTASFLHRLAATGKHANYSLFLKAFFLSTSGKQGCFMAM
jgi:hypothetical protein